MALKYKYKSREEIPAEHAGFYTERDGAWHLDAEGVVEKTKLDEIRASNSALAKERDELRQRFEGIDPEDVRKLAAEKQQLEEAAQLKAGEVDKVVENRIKGLKADWDKQVLGLTGERDALNARLPARRRIPRRIRVRCFRGSQKPCCLSLGIRLARVRAW
ncbi:MAG: hypothetical protein WCO56_29115 [Verrucomicrobiota bacterium]